jgi:hypothetical protein
MTPKLQQSSTVTFMIGGLIREDAANQGIILGHEFSMGYTHKNSVFQPFNSCRTQNALKTICGTPKEPHKNFRNPNF